MTTQKLSITTCVHCPACSDERGLTLTVTLMDDKLVNEELEWHPLPNET